MTTRGLLPALCLIVSSAAGAQLCRGGPAQGDGWAALALGVADGAASVRSADIAWQVNQGLALFAEVERTSYPPPDPWRTRAALAAGFLAAERRHSALCVTAGFERERIGDLRVERIPIGLALGWGRPISSAIRHLGFTVEPFYAHQHEHIARFAHTSHLVSARAGAQLLLRRLLIGIAHEQAFDADARSHTTARLGFTF